MIPCPNLSVHVVNVRNRERLISDKHAKSALHVRWLLHDVDALLDIVRESVAWMQILCCGAAKFICDGSVLNC